MLLVFIRLFLPTLLAMAWTSTPSYGRSSKGRGLWTQLNLYSGEGERSFETYATSQTFTTAGATVVVGYSFDAMFSLGFGATYAQLKGGGTDQTTVDATNFAMTFDQKQQLDQPLTSDIPIKKSDYPGPGITARLFPFVWFRNPSLRGVFINFETIFGTMEYQLGDSAQQYNDQFSGRDKFSPSQETTRFQLGIGFDIQLYRRLRQIYTLDFQWNYQYYRIERNRSENQIEQIHTIPTLHLGLNLFFG